MNLEHARLQCHHAVQLITHVARAYIPARDDDSHTSLSWQQGLQALAGEPFSIGGELWRTGIRLRDLTLLLLKGAGVQAIEFALEGHTFAEALAWLATGGLDAQRISSPLHFQLPDHPLLHGGRFEGDAACAELSRLYGDAASALEEYRVEWSSQPVRCWPHHFDVATLIATQTGTIGVGMSPGDASYSLPYYYVTPWPYPAADRLPTLESEGVWHTEGWTGAVLNYEHFGPEGIRRFIRDAVGKLR